MRWPRRSKYLVFGDSPAIVNDGPVEYIRPPLCSHPNAEPVRNPANYFTDYCDDCGAYGKRIGILPVKWSEFDELQRDHMEWKVYAAQKVEKKRRRALLLE